MLTRKHFQNKKLTMTVPMHNVADFFHLTLSCLMSSLNAIAHSTTSDFTCNINPQSCEFVHSCIFQSWIWVHLEEKMNIIWKGCTRIGSVFIVQWKTETYNLNISKNNIRNYSPYVIIAWPRCPKWTISTNSFSKSTCALDTSWFSLSNHTLTAHDQNQQ